MTPPSVDAIKAQVRRVPPDCLASFQTLPVVALDRSNPSVRVAWHAPEPFKTLWRLQCQCGSQRGSLLGHRLRDYNPEYRGDDFITPIAFGCTICSRPTEILDTDIHGYHAEIGKLDGGIGSAKLRGTGERSVHRCRPCNRDSFDFVVGFVGFRCPIR